MSVSDPDLDPAVRELVALCSRLIMHLRRADPGDPLAGHALEYLHRRRYLSPLRIKPMGPAPEESQGGGTTS